MDRHRRDWDELAAVDPYWAVLSEPGKRGRRWETGEFFATGDAEVEHVLARAAELRRPARRELALDFGCGVGRVTRALADRFEKVVGLDVSPVMVDRAWRNVPDTEFRVHEPPRIELDDGAADLVYANLVLQHLPERAGVDAYVREFLRVVRADGLVVFQLPADLAWRQLIQPRRRLYAAGRAIGIPANWLYDTAGLHPVSMLALPEREVRELVAEAGATVAATEPGVRYYVHHHAA